MDECLTRILQGIPLLITHVDGIVPVYIVKRKRDNPVSTDEP